MSKSIGNTIEPQEVIKESGAEILRLWVAMSDYREEVRVGKEILARVVEAYRKIRNTLPYPAWRTCTISTRRATWCRSSQLRGGGSLRAGALRRDGAHGAAAAYERVRVPDVFQALNTFATVDLSAFYVDVSKDRLYTFGAASPRAAFGADGDVHHGRRPRPGCSRRSCR